MPFLFPPDRHLTEDFLLRPFAAGDGPRLHDAVNASLAHLRPWMPWAQRPQAPEESELLARRFQADYIQAKDFILGVFSPDGAQLLGSTGFHTRGRSVEDGVAEIGMWIHGEMAGLGIGSAVLRAMLAWGFSHWPWERLEWHASVDNAASQRTAEKASMEREAVLASAYRLPSGDRTDLVIYGALKHRWPAPDGPNL